MIHDVIADKLKMSGMTQANLARLIETSPTQLGNYLKGQGSLTEKSLNKCFDILEINIERYRNIYQVAQNASEILKKKGCDFEEVIRMSKMELVRITGIEQIKQFEDVYSEEEYEDIIKYNIIDYQSTFPYFKTLVVYFMNTGEKITTKSNASTWTLLFGTLALSTVVAGPVGLLASGIRAGISAAIGAVGGVALSSILKEDRPLESFKELSRKIVKNFKY